MVEAYQNEITLKNDLDCNNNHTVFVMILILINWYMLNKMVMVTISKIISI